MYTLHSPTSPKSGISQNLLEEFDGNEGILVNAASKEYSDLIDFEAFKNAGVDVVGENGIC